MQPATVVIERCVHPAVCYSCVPLTVSQHGVSAQRHELLCCVAENCSLEHLLTYIVDASSGVPFEKQPLRPLELLEALIGQLMLISTPFFLNSSRLRHGRRGGDSFVFHLLPSSTGD